MHVTTFQHQRFFDIFNAFRGFNSVNLGCIIANYVSSEKYCQYLLVESIIGITSERVEKSVFEKKIHNMKKHTHLVFICFSD